ncbi:UDP-glucuronic acid decarboxylase 1-like [Phyllobates terribilis]|uniref:UDP-glucuronic acid decarboxylase 1-like n=1 Tax=Phyllobates terribilis TaxID=111132 RepID=UPI003CCAC705
MNSNVSSPVNLGNPEEHTILEFARLIKQLVGSGGEIQFLSEAQDDPQRRKTDIRKAKLLLGWEPVVPLEEGLNKTIHYFSKELEYQANNQYIPKPKPARIKKGRMRHN